MSFHPSVSAWGLRAETILLKTTTKKRKPYLYKNHGVLCVGVCFRLSKLSGSRKWPCLNEASQTEGVRVKLLIKRSAECKHTTHYSFMQRTPLCCCSVVCLSCFCVLQFPTAHRNNDSSLGVWLYNCHKARAYYSQCKCGGVILCSVRKYSAYETSDISII